MQRKKTSLFSKLIKVLISIVIICTVGSIYNIVTNKPLYISPEFKPFFNQFKKDADRYNVNPIYGNLTIVFSHNLPIYVAGRCNPISNSIEINATTWGFRSTDIKKVLLYHELAHCTLLRDHSEETVNIIFACPVTSDSINDLMLELHELAKEGESDEPIFLVLNTPGGSVFAGIELMNFINQLRRPVHVVANFAASMGFHILQNSPVRYITPFGIIMSHRVSGGFQGEIPGEVTSRVGHIMQVVGKMDEKVIERTNGKWNKEGYQKLIADEYWSTGSNAIKDGFADKVVTLKCDKSLNGTSEKTISTFFGFKVKVNYPDCPLFTQPSFDKSKKEVAEDVTRYLTTIQGYVK